MSIVSHTRTVVRECFKGDEANQWKRPKFDPSPHQNPLTDFCSPNTWFCRAFGVTIVCSFFGFFNKATAYTPGRIITQNTSNDVVPGKEVPFGGADDYILYLDPEISEKPSFRGPILTGLELFATENRFNTGVLKYILPLIVIVAA